MKIGILIIAALLAGFILLSGCVQPSGDDTEKDILASAQAGTGSTAADITSGDVSDFSTDLDYAADGLQGFEDTEIKDSSIDETTFQ